MEKLTRDATTEASPQRKAVPQFGQGLCRIRPIRTRQRWLKLADETRNATCWPMSERGISRSVVSPSSVSISAHRQEPSGEISAFFQHRTRFGVLMAIPSLFRQSITGRRGSRIGALGRVIRYPARSGLPHARAGEGGGWVVVGLFDNGFRRRRIAAQRQRGRFPHPFRNAFVGLRCSTEVGKSVSSEYRIHSIFCALYFSVARECLWMRNPRVIYICNRSSAARARQQGRQGEQGKQVFHLRRAPE
jgi:hypothetical protein